MVRRHRLFGCVLGHDRSFEGDGPADQYPQSRHWIHVPVGWMEFAILATICHAIWEANDVHSILGGNLGRFSRPHAKDKYS